MSTMKFREPNQVLWRGCRPGHNGVQIVKQNTAINAIAEIWTVVGVSVFYMTRSTLNYVTVAAGATNFYILNTAPVLYHTILREVVIAGGEGKSHTISFWPPLELPVGYSIKLQSIGVGLEAGASISGWGE